MGKIRKLISKTKLLEINVASELIGTYWHLLTFVVLTLIVHAVSVIELPSRKGARYWFNATNC